MKPLLSVIIPTFNRSRLLVQAINSVLCQSYHNIEIIVINDGSKDDTEKVVKQYGQKIKYFYQNNRGLNAARNRGLQESHGTYIALLDDDDLWRPWKAEIQIALLERFRSSAYIFSDFFIFSEYQDPIPKGLSTWFSKRIGWPYSSHTFLIDSSTIGPILPNSKPFRLIDCNLYEALLSAPYVLPSTAIIRRSMIPHTAPFPIKNTHCGDWAFFAILSKNYSCLYMDIETTLNRSHDDSVRLTRKSPIEKLKHRIDLIESIWKSDHSFMANNSCLVEITISNYLFKLYLYLLDEGQSDEALETLKNHGIQSSHLKRFFFTFLLIIARIPLGTYTVRLLRSLKRRLPL